MYIENMFISPKLNISFVYHRLFVISNVSVHWIILHFRLVEEILFRSALPYSYDFVRGVGLLIPCSFLKPLFPMSLEVMCPDCA
jgi:hypothetical protein